MSQKEKASLSASSDYKPLVLPVVFRTSALRANFTEAVGTSDLKASGERYERRLSFLFKTLLRSDLAGISVHGLDVSGITRSALGFAREKEPAAAAQRCFRRQMR